jgi:hypothetical protein
VLLPDVRSCEEQEMNKASTNQANIKARSCDGIR